MMNKRRKIVPFILGLIGLLTSGLAAQDLSPADLIGSNQNLQQWTAGRSNAVFLTQVGNLNDAQIQQTGATLAAPNLVRTYQQGDRNLAQITQNGQQNRTDVLQEGQDNLALSNVQGSENHTLIVQNGAANVVVQNLKNSTNVQSQFVQNGNNNRVEQEVVGQTGRTFQVTQNGNGLNAIIRVGQ